MVQLQGSFPDQVAPGESFDVTVRSVTVSRSPFDFPRPDARTVAGTLSELTFSTSAAAGTSVALSPALSFGGTVGSTGGFNVPATAAAGAPITIGPITAGPSGDPIVLRPRSLKLTVAVTTSGGSPGGSDAVDCPPSLEPVAVIKSSKPVPGAPVITSVSPDIAPAAGGTKVTLRGDNLATTYVVNGFGYPAPPFRVVDDHTLTLTTPELPVYGTQGTGQYVGVETDYGRWTSPSNDAFIVYSGAAPAIRPHTPQLDSVSPGTLTFGQIATFHGASLEGVDRITGFDHVISRSPDTVTAVAGAAYEPSSPFSPSAHDGRFELSGLPSDAARYAYVDRPVVDGGAPPAAPVLRLAGLSTYSWSVDWRKPASTSPVTAYEVYVDGVLSRRFVREQYQYPQDSDFGDFSDGAPHQVTVRARDGAGHAGPLSAPLTVQRPTNGSWGDTILRSVTPTATTAVVTWDADGDPTATYDVYLNRAYVKTVSTNSATLTGLTPSTAYETTVITRYPDGRGSGSSILNFTTLAAPAANLPVVTRVSGTGTAGVGGLFVVSGSRFSGFKAVTVGGKAAVFAIPIGNLVLVLGPALPAGQHQLVVRTSAGKSAESSRSAVTYR